MGGSESVLRENDCDVEGGGYCSRITIGAAISVPCDRGCGESSYDIPAAPTERVILVQKITAKIIPKRTTPTTMGTAMAAALTVAAEMKRARKNNQ